METKLTLIRTNLRRYTFESLRIRDWVENRARGRVLNLFAGKTKLTLPELRVDSDINMNAHGYHSTFLGQTRNFKLKELCVFAHGGAQHCTIAISESRC